MKQLIGWIAIGGMLGGLLLGGIALFIWGSNKLHKATQDISVVTVEGHKYIIVTNSQGVAICQAASDTYDIFNRGYEIGVSAERNKSHSPFTELKP